MTLGKSFGVFLVRTAVWSIGVDRDDRMGVRASQTESLRTHYQKYFRPLNEAITLKNHTFFALDAPSLVDEDYRRIAHGVSFDEWEPMPGGTVEAVRIAASRKYLRDYTYPLITGMILILFSRTASSICIVVAYSVISTRHRFLRPASRERHHS